MATEYYVSQSTADASFSVRGVSNNYVWPYPALPGYWPYGSFDYTWPSLDDVRFAVLEARIAKLERENTRLKRGLSNLYRQRKVQDHDNR